jgi:hypothetical protein
MRKPKTQAQIDKEIKALKDIKPRVRQCTGFGDNNWDAIDAQIRVLEEHMDEDDVYVNFPVQEGEEGDEDYSDGCPQNVHDSALEAARWLAGELDSDSGSLVKGDGWESIAKK